MDGRKGERSEAQKAALVQARLKAQEVRKQNAEIKKKQKELTR